MHLSTSQTFASLCAVLLSTSACGSDVESPATQFTSDAATAGDSAATDSAGSDSTAPMMATVEPNTQTKALLAAIKDYKSWDKFAENATPKLSSSHMNMWVVTYHNSVVKTAIANKTLPLPDGSIIVKDNGMSATDPMPMPTIMSKQAGKWYWVEATPDGKVVVDSMMDKGKPLEGNDVQMCTGCHGKQKDSNDWVFVHDFAK